MWSNRAGQNRQRLQKCRVLCLGFEELIDANATRRRKTGLRKGQAVPPEFKRAEELGVPHQYIGRSSFGYYKLIREVCDCTVQDELAVDLSGAQHMAQYFRLQADGRLEKYPAIKQLGDDLSLRTRLAEALRSVRRTARRNQLAGPGGHLHQAV